MNGSLLIIVVLFGLLYLLMIRPQQAKARAQQQLLRDVAVGDEILTVGGIYGIVQELEPEEEGADLVVEIADGIHVRIARKAIATVVKPEPEDDEEETAALEEGDAVEAAADAPAAPEAAVQEEEVNVEQETVNPEGAEATPSSDRS